MQIVVCAGKSQAAPGTSSEQALLWAADTDGSSLWRSTILPAKYSACPWGCCLILSAGFVYLRLQLSQSPPMPLHHTAFASCSRCHLPDDFPYSHIWLSERQEKGKERKRKWLWLGTCICALPFQAIGHSQQSCHSLALSFVHTTLVVHSSPPTQHLHRCSWVRLESTQSCWLTWNSWSWTSREYSVLFSSHSVFH